MSEQVTIAEAARRLGISRPRLSTFIKQAGLKKTVGKNGTPCVSYEQVSDLVVSLGAQGKLRVSTKTKRPNERLVEQASAQASDVSVLVTQMSRMMDRLAEENRELREAMKAEREAASGQLDRLSDKLTALQAEISTLKLLPAPGASRPGASVDLAGIDDKEFLAAVVDQARERMGERLEQPRKGGWTRLFNARRRET